MRPSSPTAADSAAGSDERDRRTPVDSGRRPQPAQANGGAASCCPVPGVERANVVVIGAGAAGRMPPGWLSASAQLSGHRHQHPASASDRRDLRRRHRHEVSNKYRSRRPCHGRPRHRFVLIPGRRREARHRRDGRRHEAGIGLWISPSTRAAASRLPPDPHDDPTFTVHNSVYYCVANMPGAVPGTATAALTNATLPFAVKIADQGWHQGAVERFGSGRGSTSTMAMSRTTTSPRHSASSCLRGPRSGQLTLPYLTAAQQPRARLLGRRQVVLRGFSGGDDRRVRKCSSQSLPAASASPAAIASTIAAWSSTA